MECKNALGQEEQQDETRETNGYTFYWQENDESEPRMHSVDFAVSNSFVTQLSLHPMGISERLMTNEPNVSAINHDQCICTSTGCNSRRQGNVLCHQCDLRGQTRRHIPHSSYQRTVRPFRRTREAFYTDDRIISLSC